MSVQNVFFIACFKSGLLPPDFVEKILKSSSTAVYTPVLKSFLPRQKSKSLLLKQALKLIQIKFLLPFLVQGCAERKAKIWIEPPMGIYSEEANQRKLYYQVEDIQSGKKENIMIPIEQIPQNLVVEEKATGSSKKESEYSATLADKMIREQRLPSATSSPPTLSYLRSLEEIETLFQKRSYTDALVKLTPLIEQYPTQVRLLLMQGTLYKKIGEKKLALKSFQAAGELEKNNPKLENTVLTLEDEIGSSQ